MDEERVLIEEGVLRNCIMENFGSWPSQEGVVLYFGEKRRMEFLEESFRKALSFFFGKEKGRETLDIIKMKMEKEKGDKEDIINYIF